MICHFSVWVRHVIEWNMMLLSELLTNKLGYNCPHITYTPLGMIFLAFRFQNNGITQHREQIKQQYDLPCAQLDECPTMSYCKAIWFIDLINWLKLFSHMYTPLGMICWAFQHNGIPQYRKKEKYDLPCSQLEMCPTMNNCKAKILFFACFFPL